MKLFEVLKQTALLLLEHPGQWAVCGGVAASIYRRKARFTDDIDFALIDSPAMSAENLAGTILRRLGYGEYIGFVPDPENNNQQLRALICARTQEDQRFAGIDFLLPVQRWIPEAVALAQFNSIDYGFAELPTVTPESLILAKLIALSGSPDRYQDLDDIQEILKSVPLKLDYLEAQIALHNLKVPSNILALIFR